MKKKWYEKSLREQNDLVKAFIIGLFGAFLFKVVEYIGQLYFGWSILSDGTWHLILISQLIFLIIISSLLVFLLMKLFNKLWIIAFVPFLYYVIKESYNIIFTLQKFTWIPFAESLIGIPIGFGLYFLIRGKSK